VDLLAEPPLRADREAVADDQHPDRQLRIDRGPPDPAVEGPQPCSEIAQVEIPVNLPEKMITRDLVLEAKAVKQPLRRRLHPHHLPVFRANPSGERNHDTKPRSTQTKSTKSVKSRPSPGRRGMASLCDESTLGGVELSNRRAISLCQPAHGASRSDIPPGGNAGQRPPRPAPTLLGGGRFSPTPAVRALPLVLCSGGYGSSPQGLNSSFR